jgi:hypothetical protein
MPQARRELTDMQLARILGRPLGRPLGYRLHGGSIFPQFDWHVDSENGSDAYDGRTRATAFATIGKLNSVLASGDRVGLARGSYWREQLGTSASISGVTVEAYGFGPMPVLDGADVASSDGWTKTPGRTNLLQRTWTHDDAANMYLSLWVNGTRVRWRTDLDTADATPGSWYAADTTGTGSTTVYYHPPGSGDPASDGNVVEISKRWYGLRGGDGWTVRNVHTRRSVHNNGSFIVLNYSQVEDCLAEDGTKHNLFVAGSCFVRRTIAWKADWADRSNSTQFIANLNIGTGHFVHMEDCISIVEKEKVAAAVAAGDQGISGFAAHTDGVNLWDKVTYVRCSVSGAVGAFGANDCLEFESDRCYATETYAALSSSAPVVVVNDLWAQRGTVVELESAIRGITGTAYVDGLRSVGGDGSGRGDIWLDGAGKVYVTNSVIYRAGGSGYRIGLNINHVNSDASLHRSIIVNNNKGVRFKGSAASDDNVFHPASMDAQIDPNNYTSIAEYQAAELSFDQNSIVADPQFADPENGDWTIGNPAVAATGAGLLRDVTSQDYTPIPSDAALAAL